METTRKATMTRVRSIVGQFAVRDRDRCSHDVTVNDRAAGIQRRRCAQCDHVSIYHVGEGPLGDLFAIPRYADQP